MADALRSFIEQARCIAEECASWPGGIDLVVRGYLTPLLPPAELVTSARAVVFRGDDVLTFFDGNVPHVLPGGRLEPGESPEQALRREVLEETGWHVGSLTVLGCLHLRHLTPRPVGYGYPYPTFLQAVFRADADVCDPASIVPDEWVQHSGFVTPAEAMALPLGAVERAFLMAALKHRAGGAVHGG